LGVGHARNDMRAYQEECAGVISVALYDVAESKAIVEELRCLEGWAPALVRRAQDAANYEILSRPEVRSASTITSPGSARIYYEFEARVHATVKPLIKQYWQLDLKDHAGTHILRYGPGDHYVPHYDTGLGFNHRYLSIVCYLNDDFEGGRTTFPGLDYQVTPEPGKAIIFPSNYLHGSEAVHSGEKFVMVSWVTGPAPVTWV